MDNSTFNAMHPGLSRIPRVRARPCGAKTRAGHPCRTPARANGRCRMHGSGGAPLGNKNALKHGMRSAEHRAWRQLLKQMRQGLEAI